ncbi:unnamed protein product [Amoebophrya sp. A25]|nr:unnamed protein product [Amoebophrya sp. A25]|eukprot:GSA25T00001944001.1
MGGLSMGGAPASAMMNNAANGAMPNRRVSSSAMLQEQQRLQQQAEQQRQMLERQRQQQMMDQQRQQQMQQEQQRQQQLQQGQQRQQQMQQEQQRRQQMEQQRRQQEEEQKRRLEEERRLRERLQQETRPRMSNPNENDNAAAATRPAAAGTPTSACPPASAQPRSNSVTENAGGQQPPEQQQVPQAPANNTADAIAVNQQKQAAASASAAGAGGDRIHRLVSSVINAGIVRAETKTGLLNSHTTYIIKVSDFGREFEIERRFTDFETLHSDLIRVCGSDALPKLPERGWGTSTNPNIVEERKPKLNMIIQSALANREALFEKSNILWTFLDLTLPSIFSVRGILHGFNFVSNNLIGELGSKSDGAVTSPVKPGERRVSRELLFLFTQLQKLVVEEKYENDRYRLEHPTMYKIVLGLLEEVDPHEVKPEDASTTASKSEPGAASGAGAAAAIAAAGRTHQFSPRSRDDGGFVRNDYRGAHLRNSAEPNSQQGGAADQIAGSGAGQLAASRGPSSVEQVIAACAEILGHTLRKSEATRTLFLRERGLDKLFRVVGKDAVLNPRVKRIFSSLLSSVGGDIIGEALANSLITDSKAGHEQEQSGKNPKPKLLEVFTDLAESDRDASFHDFLAKMLWFVWDSEQIQAFFTEDGLFLLSRLFVVNSLVTRLYTALMFAVMLANHLLDDRKRERVEDGINDLIRELEQVAFLGQLRPGATATSLSSVVGMPGGGSSDAASDAGSNASGGPSKGVAGAASSVVGGALTGLFANYAGTGTSDQAADRNLAEHLSRDSQVSVVSGYEAAGGVLVGGGKAASSSSNVLLQQDPALRAFQTELMQMGNMQASLVKIHTCLADNGNVVAAKLGLYVLREAKPRAEYLCRFYPALRPWVVHEISGNSENQCVAADILLEMTLQPVNHYADATISGGSQGSDSAVDPESIIPWYFQDGDLETALHKALLKKIEYESGMARRHFEEAGKVLNAQLEYSAQRMMIQPPRSLVLHFAARHLDRCGSGSNLLDHGAGGAAGAGDSEKEGFFAPLEKKMTEYDQAKEKLKQASEVAMRAKGSVGDVQGTESRMGKLAPKLPLGMAELMATLKSMCESSSAQFLNFTEQSSELARLEQAAKDADEELTEAERTSAKLQTERSAAQMSLQEKKLAASKLQHQIYEAKMKTGSTGVDVEASLKSLQEEVEKLEVADAAGEGTRVAAEAQVRSAKERKQELMEQLVRQKEAVRQGNVSDLRGQLLQQRGKIAGPYRKLHREWAACCAELLRSHVAQALFQQRLRELAKSLQAEQRARSALAAALAKTRDDLSAFEQALQVNDHGLDEVTAHLLY